MAMELVRLGDSSADAYEKCAALFKENLVALAPYENQRDGLGLEYRLTGCVQKRAGSKMEIAEDGVRNGDQHKSSVRSSSTMQEAEGR
jgi:hypothetical protein